MAISKIIITRDQLNQMIEHSRADAPAEACGLLVGKHLQIQKLYKMKNIDESNKKYLMDPKEQFKVFKQIREEGLKLIGIYHSHVATKAYPSETDRSMAMYDVAYFIVSLMNEEPLIKAYRIKKGEVSEQEYEIV